MKLAAFVAAAAVLIGAAPAPISQRDFDQLMRQAALAGASTAPTTPVCLEANLRPPLQDTRPIAARFPNDFPGQPVIPANWGDEHPGLDKAFELALTEAAPVAPETVISSAPPPLKLVSSKTAVLPECIELGPQPPWTDPFGPSRLRLTRPVIVNGFAFIDTEVTCAGLCGNAGLLVFQKQHGKWKRLEVQWVQRFF
jgi:hypothetical protein